MQGLKLQMNALSVSQVDVLHFAVTIFIVPAVRGKVPWLAEHCHTSWYFDEVIGSCRVVWWASGGACMIQDGNSYNLPSR